MLLAKSNEFYFEHVREFHNKKKKKLCMNFPWININIAVVGRESQ